MTDSVLDDTKEEDVEVATFADININLTGVSIVSMSPSVRDLIFTLADVPANCPSVTFEVSGLYDLNYSFPNKDDDYLKSCQLSYDEDLTIRACGSGILQIAIFHPKTKDLICQRLFAMCDSSQEPDQQMMDMFLSTIEQHPANKYIPEILFDVVKINNLGRHQNRSLILSSDGVKNVQANGKTSSVGSWLDIKSAVDKGDVMHYEYNDGKKRQYQTKMASYICTCGRQYHQKFCLKIRRQNSEPYQQ